MNQILAAVVALIAAFAAGVWYEKSNTAAEVDGAVITALRGEAKRNEEVVNGWSHAVTYLRTRLRDGDAPKIPVPATPGTPTPPGGAAGAAAPGILAARELATCRAERQRLIEDGAQTMITCRALQQWAK